MATRNRSVEPAASAKPAKKARVAPVTAAKRSPPGGTPRQRAASSPAPAASPAAAKPRAGAKNLLRAGLEALGHARNDSVKRQTHVIESLIGVRAVEEMRARAFPALDGFRLHKFEDVFDQRVAAALQRLGVPGAQELEALREEVRQLRAQLADGGKPPPRTRR